MREAERVRADVAPTGAETSRAFGGPDDGQVKPLVFAVVSGKDRSHTEKFMCTRDTMENIETAHAGAAKIERAPCLKLNIGKWCLKVTRNFTSLKLGYSSPSKSFGGRTGGKRTNQDNTVDMEEPLTVSQVEGEAFARPAAGASPRRGGNWNVS